jgi:deoxyhypusine synthase
MIVTETTGTRLGVGTKEVRSWGRLAPMAAEVVPVVDRTAILVIWLQFVASLAWVL